MKIEFKKILIVSIILLLISCLYFKTAILYSKSSSMPYKLFFLIRKSNYQPKVGDYVAIKNHVTMYTPDWHFTKIVGGVAGDLISFDPNKQELFVNQKSIGILKVATMDVRALNLITTHVIPPHFIFVYGNSPDSFDSRYNEFGLVSLDEVEGVVYPLC